MFPLHKDRSDRFRSGDGGQATALFITTLSVILVLLFSAIHTGQLGSAKVATCNSIDAIALSAATWEARCLNIIATLNDGILQCMKAIRHICVVWAALAVAACTGSGIAAFTAYSKRAPEMIRSYWNCAKQLERWAETIRKAAPFLVLAETADLSKKLDVSGVLSPGNPNGRHDGTNTLELHLKQGPPINLSESLSPITAISARLNKSKGTKRISGTILHSIETAVRSIRIPGPQSIRILEPEEDFSDRQIIRYSGFKTVSYPPIPYIGKDGKDRFFSEACAEPYGGGTADMTWKSRWIERSKKR